ncbi:MAG: signal transduction histidine-protein kinase BaeS [Euryarchaeota archaeon ADurb.Bin023]|nr:HAMP domain-containing histidine kinase [Petrotogaceae bacterium]OQC50473.1 MAG: signal transduction histidine-protein kinase BaeS [Euryarchaeota archaeon ADurb.Bin023]HNV04901.1 HAMP domain-containing sensor histidine kinase [Petrotogaceae bacterium]HOG34776.1 HAMP domain-containing sensor histidine kinase [Petrotogaceae bacterium]HPO26681.1 HAMP domain-containing sensor histidine kinase [Petrotogaceae bacterium]
MKNNFLKKLSAGVKRNIRIQIIIVFAVSIAIGGILAVFCEYILSGNFNYGYEISEKITSEVASQIEEIDEKTGVNEIQEEIKEVSEKWESYFLKVYILNYENNIVYRYDPSGELEDTFPPGLFSIVQNSGHYTYDTYFLKFSQNGMIKLTDAYYNEKESTDEEDTEFPKDGALPKVVTSVSGKGIYNSADIILMGERYILVTNIKVENPFGFLSVLSPLIQLGFFIFGFIVSFIYLTQGKLKYIQDISKGLQAISKGDFEYRVPQKGDDEIGLLAKNINSMADELKKSIYEERRSEKLKNELITNVSHDLRTPLTSVMGYLRLYTEKKYDSAEQAQEYIDIAYKKSISLKELIDDLFEYTKLNNFDIKLDMEVFDINRLARQVIQEIMPVALEKNIKFETNLKDQKFFINADAGKMARVVENIISNAIKYSGSGSRIDVVSFKRDCEVILEISNPSDSINDEDLKNIFERFYRIDKSRSGSLGGSGLGLSIAKSIIHLHEGKIWAEYKDSKVSIFICMKLSKESSQCS